MGVYPEGLVDRWCDYQGNCPDNSFSFSLSDIVDSAHTALDGAGLTPGVGFAPDLLNAGMYALRGDMGNACISAAAAIPVVGQAVTGGKYAAKEEKYRIQVKDVTRKGAKARNFEVDKTLNQFEQHLLDNGFLKSIIDTKKGPINTFLKDGIKEFTTRGFSNSTDGPTGELFRGNKMAAKIRFQEGE